MLKKAWMILLFIVLPLQLQAEAGSGMAQKPSLVVVFEAPASFMRKLDLFSKALDEICRDEKVIEICKELQVQVVLYPHPNMAVDLKEGKRVLKVTSPFLSLYKDIRSFKVIIAHEMGHFILGHEKKDKSKITDITIIRNAEIAADREADRLLCRLGEDPYKVRKALVDETMEFYGHWRAARDTGTHPSLFQRLASTEACESRQ